MLSRVLMAAGGIGAAAIILCAVAAALIIMLGDVPAASADHSATECILRLSGTTHPVTYLGEERRNPDGTYYPGDAFYYVFRWSEQSDDHAGCAVRAPLLETSRLHLDHRAVWVDANGHENRRAPLVHQDLDPSVAFLSSTDFYAGKKAAECRETFSKPGESHTWKRELWTVYDRVFLTKVGDDRLTDFEKTFKSKGYRGDPAWTWWTERIPRPGSAVDHLLFCPWQKYFGSNIKGGIIPDEQKLNVTGIELTGAPPHMERYGGSSSDIFYATTHGWGITAGGNASHAHLITTPADPDSAAWLEERVRECDGLPARSGCVYGTAEVRGNSGVCASEVVGAYDAVLDAWHKRLPPYDTVDGYGNREKPPPPPGYPASSWEHWLSNRTHHRAHAFDLQAVPPGMHPEAYDVPPGGDACAKPATDGAKLELTVSGSYWTAQHKNNGIPVRGLAEASRDRGPSLQDGELLIILTKPPLRHADGGYGAKNQDGTYYHDDPVYVRHEPSWKWKDERSAHINFTTHRLPPPALPVVDEFDCPVPPGDADENGTSSLAGMGPPHVPVLPCSHEVDVDSPPWLRDTLWFGNGDGLTVRVADTSYAFGSYAFAYDMTAYNLDKPVANATNSTAVEIVPYDPLYETVYSYPVLGDAQEYAFDDRRGIIVKYAGSLQDGQVHEQRRSFVNWWNASGGGYGPSGYAEFDREHVLGGGRSAPPDADPTVLEYSAGAQTAMFASAGYGVLHMEWPVSEYVFAELVDEQNRTARGAKYANIEAQSEFHSVGFAGHQDVSLFSDAMRYPEMPFAKNVVVRSIDQRGDVQWGDTITLRVVPYAGVANDQAEAVESWREREEDGSGWWTPWSPGTPGASENATAGNATSPADQLDLEGAEYLADYMRDKVMYDTDGDQTITESMLNDTHSMVQEWTGRGQVDATVLRTSAYFADIAIQQQMNSSHAFHPNVTSGTPARPGTAGGDSGGGGSYVGGGDRAGRPSPGANAGPPSPLLQDLGEVLFGLADKPEALRLTAPLDIGLSMLPPTSVYVSINGGEERAFHHKYYAFGGSEIIHINVRADNVLDVARAGTNGTAIIVRQPDNFGAMTAVEISGTKVGVPCIAGCTLAHVPANSTIRVTAYNEWGGEAHALVPPADVPLAAPAPEDPGWRVFAGAALVLVAAAYVFKKIFGKKMVGSGDGR